MTEWKDRYFNSFSRNEVTDKAPTTAMPQFRKKRYEMSFYLTFIGIILLACFLRLQYIELRPFHTDEAENAYLLAKDLEGEAYIFNPQHNHGPTLHYLLKAACLITGTNSFAQMNEWMLRIVIVGVGLLTILLLPGLTRSIGKPGIIASALLIATSPLLIYYSTYVIHETLLGFLTLLFILLGTAYTNRPNQWMALTIGLAAGTLFATKITASIILFSWLLPCVFCARDWIKKEGRDLKKDGAYFLIGGVFSTVLFYSSFFQNLHGVWDAFASFFVYQTEIGHEKPWSYFISSFLIPNWKNPYFTHESIVVICTLLGVVAIIRNIQKDFAFVLLSSTIIQLIIYSMIPYKTPWLILVPWLQCALLAGIGISHIWKKPHLALKILCMVLFSCGLLLQVRTHTLLNQRFHSDVRNPLVYSPTSSSIRKLPAFLDHFPDEQIDVFGSFIWPTPWYLRHRKLVTYHEVVTDEISSKIIIVTDETYPKLKERINEEFDLYPYTLRPNFPIYVCIHKELSGTFE